MDQATSLSERHYTSGDLRNRIEKMLSAAGAQPSTLTPDQSAMFDQFHVRGVLATRELAALAQFRKEDRVLDVGCGIGGGARLLNHTVGCRVTGIDVTAEFIDTARWLTTALGQDGSVDFVHGSALDTPFDDESFDGAWMQHVNMNVEDKPGLFRELSRVLKSGARFAFHEVLADKAEQPHFPAPWSRTSQSSHLAREPEFRGTIERAGFRIEHWRDETRASAQWMAETFAKTQREGPPPLNIGIVLGPEFGEMAENAHRSLEEGRIKVVMALTVKK